MIKQLHVTIRPTKAGYIDSMPEGPWIKRNPYGVVFTEDMMPSENSISLGDTFRHSDSDFMESKEDSEEEEAKKTISKKEEFLKKLRFDEKVEAKLNRMIQGSDRNKWVKNDRAIIFL